MKKSTSPRLSAEKNGARQNGDRLDQKKLLAALSAFKRGDFSVRLPDDWTGLAGKVADTFNEVIGMNQRLARELDRIGQVVGKEGRISQRASIGDVGQCWAEAIRLPRIDRDPRGPARTRRKLPLRRPRRAQRNGAREADEPAQPVAINGPRKRAPVLRRAPPRWRRPPPAWRRTARGPPLPGRPPCATPRQAAAARP